jgi:magnesium transporter
MLNIFTLANGRLFQEEIESLEELSRFQPIWVDLESPTIEEKALDQTVLRPVHS